jgi:hypothetical protein
MPGLPPQNLKMFDSRLGHPGATTPESSKTLELLDSLMRASGASGNLTTDVYLAALAIEHQAEVHSNDSDFARFPACAGPILYGRSKEAARALSGL